MSAITIATINLRNRLNRWSERRHLLRDELLRTQPDLVSLQEINLLVRQGVWLRNQLNSRLVDAGGTPYTLLQKRKAHPIKGFQEGVGILSRLPIVAEDWLALGYGGRVALRATVELPGKQVLDFVATHLHHIAHDREARLEQAMAIVGNLNDTARIPLQVIAGDLNEVPDGPAVQYLRQGYRSAYAAVHGYDPLATFPTALVPPNNNWAGCLDYIFVSTSLKVTEARIFCNRPAAHDDTLYPSDHVGLLATVRVPPPGRV
jgi:endonuclease/exonuclease/phosphatase family metal-dependent hydrolase